MNRREFLVTIAAGAVTLVSKVPVRRDLSGRWMVWSVRYAVDSNEVRLVIYRWNHDQAPLFAIDPRVMNPRSIGRASFREFYDLTLASGPFLELEPGDVIDISL